MPAFSRADAWGGGEGRGEKKSKPLELIRGGGEGFGLAGGRPENRRETGKKKVNVPKGGTSGCTTGKKRGDSKGGTILT